jgi:hypothetical protein
VQSNGLNAVHIGALFIAGGLAGLAIHSFPDQEASAALLLTAAISAIVISWTYQAGRFDSEKKEHSVALNNQFFLWTQRLDFGPSWDNSEYPGGFPYCPALRVRASEAPRWTGAGQTEVEVPLSEIPLYAQATSHLIAYPVVSAALNECNEAASSFNQKRTEVLGLIALLVGTVMQREYPNLSAGFVMEGISQDWYDRTKLEWLVYLRARHEVGDRMAFIEPPYVPTQTNPPCLYWRGQPLLNSSRTGQIDPALLMGHLMSVWTDREVVAGVAEMNNRMNAAVNKLEPLAREFSSLSARLSTGHRILGTCENGV